MDLLYGLLTDYTLRTVALGAALLGLTSGALGTYAVLRRQSLLGDAISHAALPGIALAFLITGSKATIVLIIGAAVAGWLATGLIMTTSWSTRIKYDSALGLTLSVFFGIGLLILTAIQKLPSAQQAGLDTYLFGQASTLVQRDVVTMAILGGLTLVATALLWKEFKLLSFDPEFARSIQLPIRVLDVAMTVLLVVAIVIGLQTVGVVLMSAMLIAPAAAARQWTDRLGFMMVLSMGAGAVAGVSGALVSATGARLPTGPTIVLCVSAIVVFSMALAPNRGLVWGTVRRYRKSLQLGREALLVDLFALALQHTERTHAHNETALALMRPDSGSPRRKLRRLEETGLVERVEASLWRLTDDGVTVARRLHSERKTGGQP